MTNLILKLGLFTMVLAGCFIIIAFFMFLAFAFAIILPGLIIYNIGLKMCINDQDFYDENGMKIISEAQKTDPFTKIKSLFKSGLKKTRNFLNKYVD